MDVGDDLILGGDKDDDMFGFMELEELDGSLAGEIFGAEAFARGEGAKASGGELVKSDKKGNKDEKGGKRGKGPVRVGGEPSPDVLAARVAELERENARLRRMSGSLDEDDGNGCGADAGKNARTSAAEVQVAKNERKKNEKKKNEKKKKKKAGKDRGKEQEQKQERESEEEMPAARERVDVRAWREYHLEEEVLEAIAELGFVAPTQIQAECLPSAVRDRMDIIGAAQTGSGKTLAFGLPILSALCKERKVQGAKKAGGSLAASRLRALIMVPTRELCMQVFKALDPIARHVNVRVVPIVGGISHQKQERLISKHPPEIVVATPGRYWELVGDGHAHLNDYSALSYLVLDEADKMVQQGHFQELTSIFQMVSSSTAGDHRFQTFVFSATLMLPSDMKKRLRKGGGGGGGAASLEELMDAVPFRAGKKPKIVDVSPEMRLAERITESFLSCPEKERDVYLYCLLAAHPGRTIVFVNAISSVRRLGAVLKVLGLPVRTLHAGMQQRARLKALDAFTKDINGILVATDVAARGLDVKNVECVIHYQVPASADTYVHRSGRTARAERDGISIALVTPKEHVRFRALLHSIGHEDGIPEFPVDLSLLAECRDRVRLAVKYDSLTRHDSKNRADKSWMKTNAEQLDIMLSDSSDEEDELGNRGKDHITEQHEAQARKIKVELDELLSEPLQPKFSRKFMFGGAMSGVATALHGSGGGNGIVDVIRSGKSMAEERVGAKRPGGEMGRANGGKRGSNVGADQPPGGPVRRKKKKPRSRQEALAAAVQKHLSRKERKKFGGRGSGMTVVANPFGRSSSGSTALQAMKNSNSNAPIRNRS